MARSTRARGVPPAIYQHLLNINVGFEQVRVALRALEADSMFDRRELARFRTMSAETRAAIASYLLEVIETKESDEAGRLSQSRAVRERAEDPLSP